ncbi:MAG: DivIVA domain-containing protein [Solirubrobacteraceae bacterium]
MSFDRQAIERRDFPVGRRGYDPGAVDSHLRALAAEFEELQRVAASGSGDVSLASTAGTQVQSILEAAEAAASEIERTAQENARQVRETADRDAERTREEALEKARAHVAAVAQVTATLLERVGSMDAEVNALVGSLRTGAGRLAADLSAVEAGMSELYGAAAGRVAGEPEPQQPAPVGFEAALDTAMAMPAAAPGSVAAPSAVQPVAEAPAGPAGGADLDGARLIALNMALNGESRSDTERYLAENFQLPDRLKLIDEVYAAIEG